MMDNNRRGSAYVVLELSLTNILSMVKPSEEDREKRLNIISNLTTAIRSLETLRDATVEPFGSFVSNLYTKWGDLDISVELSNTNVSSIARSSKQRLLRDIFKVLRKGGVRGLQYIPNARVPILIFQSKHTISCDLSVNNLLGQVKSKYFLWITEIDERFRDLVLLVKEWAKAQNINNPKAGTLNSYSLCLLVIFHLQTCRPAILPPLKGIFEGNIADYLTGSGRTAVRYIEDTCATNIARFKLERHRQVNWSSLTELFVSFFKKFSNLETMSADHAICTYTGRYEPIGSNAKWVEKPCQLIVLQLYKDFVFSAEMGRRKIPMEFITCEKRRLATFKRRNKGMKKMNYILSKCCDIDVLMNCSVPGVNGQSETHAWSEDPATVCHILNKYEGRSKEEKAKYNVSLSTALEDRNKKLERDIQRKQEERICNTHMEFSVGRII